MNSKTKAVLYAAAFILALGVYREYQHRAELKELEDKRQELLAEVEKDKRKALANQKKEADSIYRLMEAEIYGLQETTRNLNRKIRYYETRPDINLDFLTSADIIISAEYRPRPGDGNP